MPKRKKKEEPIGPAQIEVTVADGSPVEKWMPSREAMHCLAKLLLDIIRKQQEEQNQGEGNKVQGHGAA